MKKILGFILLMALVINVSVYAQSNEASSSPQNSDVQKLKDKLAAKVAELQKKDQKAITGLVSDNKSSKVRITAVDNSSYDLKIDDVITKIYDIASGNKKEIKVTDLKKGDYIIVTGPVSDRVVTVNFIYRDDQFLLGSGKITEVNSTNLYIKVLTPEKETVTLDIATSTKKLLADVKAFTEDTVGLSKIKEGDTVRYVVKKTGNEREKNRYTTTKILIIPQEYFKKYPS